MYTEDKYGNIYDILGNVREWTTEFSSSSIGPCVVRGGYYNHSSIYAAGRNDTFTSYSADIHRFQAPAVRQVKKLQTLEGVSNFYNSI